MAIEVERVRKLTAIVGGTLAMAVALVSNIETLAPLLLGNIIIVSLILCIIANIAIWPRKGARPMSLVPQKRISTIQLYKTVIVVNFLSIIAISYLLYEFHYRKNPGNLYHKRPSISFLSTALAQATNLPVIDTFRIAEKYTTFSESRDQIDMSEGAESGRKIKRNFGMSDEFFNRDKERQCMDGVLRRFSDAVDGTVRTAKALRIFLTSNGKSRLVNYINTSINAEFVGKRPDIASQFIPTDSEWKELRKSSDTETYETILNWVKYCVGIPYPVFDFVIENKNDKNPISVTAIEYHVIDIGGYKAVENGTLAPLSTITHEINYEKGIQRREIDPFVIGPNSFSRFLLQIFNGSDRLGMSWRMKIRLITNVGSVDTEEFQLFMSGSETWSKGIK